MARATTVISCVALVVSMLLGLGMARAEEPATTTPPVTLCRQSLPCLQQMVDDLRAYREYLEDQLSLAKSLLNQANQRIAQQAQQLQALQEPGEGPEKK